MPGVICLANALVLVSLNSVIIYMPAPFHGHAILSMAYHAKGGAYCRFNNQHGVLFFLLLFAFRSVPSGGDFRKCWALYIQKEVEYIRERRGKKTISIRGRNMDVAVGSCHLFQSS